jgi:hypothetical protein
MTDFLKGDGAKAQAVNDKVYEHASKQPPRVVDIDEVLIELAPVPAPAAAATKPPSVPRPPKPKYVPARGGLQDT